MKPGGLSLLVAGLVALAAPASAEDVLRIKGAVNYRNYPAFAKLLFEAADKPVALDVTIPLDNEETEGHLSTFVLDGQFEVAFHSSADGSKIYADTGFEFVDENYYALKGDFVVQPGDDGSGTRSIMLEPKALPKGASFREVDAATLEEQ